MVKNLNLTSNYNLPHSHLCSLFLVLSLLPYKLRSLNLYIMCPRLSGWPFTIITLVCPSSCLVPEVPKHSPELWMWSLWCHMVQNHYHTGPAGYILVNAAQYAAGNLLCKKSTPLNQVQLLVYLATSQHG